MDRKKLKERIARDEVNAIEKALNEGKKRGRKPRIDKQKEFAAQQKMTEIGLVDPLASYECDKAKSTIQIIEEEVGGKEKLVRLAVKYLYNAITEEC